MSWEATAKNNNLSVLETWKREQSEIWEGNYIHRKIEHYSFLKKPKPSLVFAASKLRENDSSLGNNIIFMS